MNWNKIFDRKNSQGLSKVKLKLKKLGFKKTFKIFNVVGTNGKGSVSQYLTDSFIKSGKKVGTFTSPHIFKANERIKINNKNISNKDFFKIAKKLDFSFFETLFIVAMLYFQENNIDIAIIEAGIGGAKDTTNAIDGDYGVVTSIGLDHESLLGNTREKIAKDKSGIINSKMKFFIPNSIDPILRKYFQKENYEIIKNKASNYKMENINLVKGIAKSLNIIPVINEVPYRTTIKNKNGFIAIKDVAHNYDGIQATLKYLENKKINFDKVVLSINEKKWKPEILDLFKGKEIKFYKEDEKYYVSGNEIKDLTKEFEQQTKDTLYIGTFKIISKLKDKDKKTKIIKKILFGNINSYKLNIFMITISALFLCVSQIIGHFLRFKIGPMEISFDYVFYMIFGLFFGFIYGSLFSLINDLLKSVFTIGFGYWMWEYAIIPTIMIPLISSIFKEFVWNRKNNWFLKIIMVFIITDCLSLVTVIINNFTSTYEFKNNHHIYMNLFYVTLPILVIIQTSLLFYYLFSKNRKVIIKRFINSIALTMIILVVVSWIWGPFAFHTYANRFIYSKPETIKNKYSFYLIPRIIKAIPEGLVWSFCLFSLYEITNISTKNILKSRW